MATQSNNKTPNTNAQTTEVAKTSAQKMKIFQEEMVGKVEKQVQLFQDSGELVLPKNYIVSNAMKAASLIIIETKDKDGNYALDVCTSESIYNSLLKMAVWGLNALKKQCDFIVKGNRLVCEPEYTGSILMAKRFAGLQDIKAQVVYEGEEFITAIDPTTGREQLVKHVRNNDVDDKKITRGYAIMKLKDGTTDMEVMTYSQVVKAWEMAPGRKEPLTKAHTNFPDQMVKKTVYQRACKLLIRTSDDALVMPLDETEDIEHEDLTKIAADEKKLLQAHKKEISMGAGVEDITPVDERPEAPKAEGAKPTPQPAQNKQNGTQVKKPTDDPESGLLFSEKPTF